MFNKICRVKSNYFTKIFIGDTLTKPFRVKDVVHAGKLEDNDITVDCGKWYNLKVADNTISDQAPILGWNPFPSRPVPSNLNYGHVYHYLLESVVLIGEKGKVEDTSLAHMTSKPLNKGEQYVKSGAVTSIMDATQGEYYYIKAMVDASMRNKQRTVTVTLSSISVPVRGIGKKKTTTQEDEDERNHENSC